MCINNNFDFISEPTLRLEILILNGTVLHKAKIHIVKYINIVFIIVIMLCIILLNVLNRFTFAFSIMILQRKYIYA